MAEGGERVRCGLQYCNFNFVVDSHVAQGDNDSVAEDRNGNKQHGSLPYQSIMLSLQN